MRLLTNGAVDLDLPSGLNCRGPSVRLRGALFALPCWAVIAVALYLSPRAAGYGTHQELGLPPCSFTARSHLPGPLCGMTTSMSAMAHGDVVAAFVAQPFGVLLFVAVAVVAMTGTLETLFGRDCLHFLRLGMWCVWVALLGVLTGWGLKLAMGFASGTLPLR